MNFGHLALIAAGGGIGAMARYLFGIGAAQLLGSSFAWGTLGVNVIGSFMIGLMAQMLPAADAGGRGYACFSSPACLAASPPSRPFRSIPCRRWSAGRRAGADLCHRVRHAFNRCGSGGLVNRPPALIGIGVSRGGGVPAMPRLRIIIGAFCALASTSGMVVAASPIEGTWAAERRFLFG